MKLQSSDGEIFEVRKEILTGPQASLAVGLLRHLTSISFSSQVDVEIAKASNTIKTMIEDLGLDEDDDEPVPLPNVNGAIMRKVTKI